MRKELRGVFVVCACSFSSIPRGSSLRLHLKTIRIHQSCLSFCPLLHVIHSCEALQEFEYLFGSFQVDDERPIIYGLDLSESMDD